MNLRTGALIVFALILGIASVTVFMGLAKAKQESPSSPDPKDDTEVLSQGWNNEELTRILDDFKKLYQATLGPQFHFQTTQLPGGSIRITFPGDIPPAPLSFLVNYLQYPVGFDLTTRSIAVLGRVKLTRAYPVPNSRYIGRNARIYVPSNDTDHDLVYVEVDSQFYSQSFADMAWEPVRNGRIPKILEAIW